MKRHLFIANKRKRRAISEIMGTIIMIAITLGAGAAVFGWVNGQAGVSESALGQSSAKQFNYFAESFVIVSIQFGNTTYPCQTSSGQTWCNQVSVAVYNNGEIGLTVQNIAFGNASSESASDYKVPMLSVSLTLTNAATGTYAMTSYTCGSTTGHVASEHVSKQSQPIAKESSPPAVFTFALPATCPTTSGILDGALYSVQVLGLYGNVVTSEVTANG